MTDNPSSASGAIAKAQLLIRRPAAEIFAALVDPEAMSRFWFTRGSGRLEAGSRVRWEWEMYGVGDDVVVRELDPGRRLLFDWGADGEMTSVEWTLEPRGAADSAATSESTFVVVRNWGFQGDAEKVMAAALDTTGGWTSVLSALKAWLEHGIVLDLVLDHAPDNLLPEWIGRGSRGGVAGPSSHPIPERG